MNKKLAKMTLLFSFLLIFLICFSAKGEDKTQDPLDLETRNALNGHSEIYAYSGFFFGDTLGNSYLSGIDYTFHFDRVVGLGFSFGYFRAKYSDSVTLNQGGFFNNKNTYVLDATLMFVLPAAFKAGKNTVFAELYSVLGTGMMSLNSFWEPQGFIGGGMKIFITRQVAIRVDMRTSMHSTTKPDGTKKFDQDLNMLIGISLQIPPAIR